MNPQLLFRFGAILHGLWRRRYAVTIPIFILPILGLLVALAMPRTYQSSTTLLIQEDSKLNPFLADISVATNLEQRMASLDALLHSHHMLSRVVDELQLAKAESTSDHDEAVDALSKNLSVTLVGKELIKITYKNNSPANMEPILTSVTKQFLEFMLAPQQSSLDSSEAFLTEQLKRQQEGLQQAQDILINFKREHSANLPEFQGKNVELLRSTENRIAEQETKLKGSRAALATLNTQLSLTNPVVSALEEQIVQTTGELAVLRSRYTDEHSQVQAALRKLRRLEEERNRIQRETQNMTQESIARLWDLANAHAANTAEDSHPLLVIQLKAIQDAKAEEQRLQTELESLQQQQHELQQKIKASADIEQKLQTLERDLNTKQKIYDDFLKRNEMAKITGALGRFEQPDRVKMIEAPRQPKGPTNLPTLAFVAAGLIAGIGLGLSLALIMELLDSTVRDQNTLSTLLGVPVLVRIPCISKESGTFLDLSPVTQTNQI